MKQKSNLATYFIANFLVIFILGTASLSMAQTTLFSDNFSDGNYTGWTIVDQGTISGPSNWQVVGGEMVQSSNIYGPAVGSVDNRKGTFAYYNDPQTTGWLAYSVDATLRSSDDDGIGLMFCYQDQNNYYKLDMDSQRNFRKLFKMVNGVETTLASISGGYTANVNMAVNIKFFNGQIHVNIDGQDVFGGPVTDASLNGGSIALYSWGAQNAIFDNIIVQDISLVADAGQDQVVTDGDISGFESVTLDGSGSVDLDGSIVSYEWYENSTLIATGVNPVVDFAVGTHLLTLTVTDNDSNTDSDTMTVTVTSGSSFKLVLLPDTQKYSASYPSIFTSQTQWIVDNKNAENIKFVLHEGDITDNNTAAQWNNANTSLSVLDGNVPYLLVPGNHDNGTNGSSDVRNTTLFNSYFPVSRFSGTPNFGGVYETGKLDNHYQLFSAGGTDWLVIGLEFGPRDPVLDWANSVVASYPDRRVIVVTHAHMYSDETQHGSSPTQSWNPHAYGVANEPGGVNDGVEVWNKFLRLHPNISFVFNGHVLNDGKGRLISIGDNGNKVYQILANYQMLANGGNGYLRLMEFDPVQGTVSAKSYSPYLNQFLTDSENQFEYTNVDLGAPALPHIPQADAGTDQIVTDTDSSGAEDVVLDGSGSSDPNGSIVAYEWREAGLLIATGVSPSVSLSVGTHVIELTVIDNDSETDTDFVTVTVNGDTVLLHDDFGDGDFAGWAVVDEGILNAPSAWQVLSGELVQSSNIHGPDANAVTGRKGTFAYYNDAAAFLWADYSIDATLRSNDNDGIGIMFYYQDPSNYYKLDMDSQRNFRKLFKMVNGVESTLATSTGAYLANTNMAVHIEVSGNQISISIDGAVLFGGPVTDSDLSSGTVAMYCWGEQNGVFDDVIVQEINTTVLLSENFSGTLADWSVVDEGILEGPSAWQIIGGELVEPSNIYGPDRFAETGRKGTFAYYNPTAAFSWSNYTVDAVLRSSDNDGIGIMFYYQDPANYYKLDLDSERNFRKLFKMVNGVETTIASSAGAYTLNVNMAVHVEVINGQITVLIDGQSVFGGSVADSSLAGGTIALYSWGTASAFFDDINVE